MTLEDLDFSFQPALKREQIESLTQAVNCPPPHLLGASSRGSGQCGTEEDALQKGPLTLSILCSQATNSPVFGAHRPAFKSK